MILPQKMPDPCDFVSARLLVANFRLARDVGMAYVRQLCMLKSLVPDGLEPPVFAYHLKAVCSPQQVLAQRFTN
jgi:hypothetical protein